jgi:hypothetical protein
MGFLETSSPQIQPNNGEWLKGPSLSPYKQHYHLIGPVVPRVVFRQSQFLPIININPGVQFQQSLPEQGICHPVIFPNKVMQSAARNYK